VQGGVVAPPAQDTSDQIISWVDGQPVTDWASEIRKRDEAIDRYVNDADPARAAKYGFRSGQNPQLAWSWFRDYPVGFNGVPLVLFKTLLDLNPDHSNPTLRAIARVWKREAIVPVPTGKATSQWTLDHLGVGPNPIDYVDGVARPAAQRQSPLPYGFAFENSRTFEPLSAAETQVYDGRLLARRTFQNTSLLVAKLRATGTEENWERDRPGFGSPGTLDRVFFSCAACHVGRVVVGGRMKFLPGMPNTEIEGQYYSKLLMLTAAALTESGFDVTSTTPVASDGATSSRPRQCGSLRWRTWRRCWRLASPSSWSRSPCCNDPAACHSGATRRSRRRMVRWKFASSLKTPRSSAAPACSCWPASVSGCRATSAF
jgi:hypothetical protein